MRGWWYYRTVVLTFYVSFEFRKSQVKTMQRSASPDITEGPPSEPRRPGRPRKIQPDANNISSTSSVSF